MKITFLVHALDLMGGTERSIVTQANVLAARHNVEILSVFKTADRPHFEVSPRVRTQYLVRSQRGAPPRLLRGRRMSKDRARQLHSASSVLVPTSWDRGFTALSDVAIEPALESLDAEVVITVTPALLSLAAQFAPPRVAIVHQEHRASTQRTAGMTPLLGFAPRADLVAVLTDGTATWLREQLGPTAPHVAAVPNPLPVGFKPRSRLDAPIIMAAGRLAAEKQFGHLIRAFDLVSDKLPEWRLRIFGDGPQRGHLESLVRKLKLFDRVEMPGTAPDLSSEWAKASLAALTSQVEGFPLVVQEAMSAGVPVVSYDCPSGPRELIRHEQNGLLVPPDSIRGMAGGLLRLAHDVELRSSMGKAALEFSHQFDPERIAATWETLLLEAVERAQSRELRSRTLRRASENVRNLQVPDASEPSVDRDSVYSSSVIQSPSPTPTVSPSEGRRLALQWAVDTAVHTNVSWLVIPPVEGSAPVVVVPDSHRSRYLELLDRRGVPPLLSLHHDGGYGWPEVCGPVVEMTRYLRQGIATHVRLQAHEAHRSREEADLYSQGCGVDIEFWHVTEGEMVAPRKNIYTPRVSLTEHTTDMEVDGVPVRTLPLMTRPTVYDRSFPVDAVYTWVDGGDPAWLAKRDRRLSALTGGAPTEKSSGAGRYRSRDELRYSLRSVHLFAPWIRHVYLVTDGQVPSWLDTEHPDVTVVDHADILDPAHLPTFNSHAIETGLHRIPDLSEHFIYFNDDVLLGRPVGKELFFSPSGQTAMFVSPEEVGLEVPDAPPYLQAAFNNRRLLERDFGRTITSALLHTPHPLRRSVIADVEERYSAEFRGTAAAPFRSPTDVAPLSSLTQYYSLLTGGAYVGEIESRFVPLAAPDLNRRLDTALNERAQDTLCLGDFHEYALPASWVNHRTREFLSEYLPLAAPWECETS